MASFSQPAANPVESEIKVALPDAAAYERVCAGLGKPARELQQRNTFVDTPDGALARHKLALRLRDENGASSITLKGPKSMLGGAMQRLEIEVPIDAALRRTLATDISRMALLDVAPVATVRATLRFTRLVEALSFSNVRRCYPMRLAERHLTLEVDRTTFGDGSVDHEIEVELDAGLPLDAIEAVVQALRALLEGFGVAFKLQPDGKLKRAKKRMS